MKTYWLWGWIRWEGNDLLAIRDTLAEINKIIGKINSGQQRNVSPRDGSYVYYVYVVENNRIADKLVGYPDWQSVGPVVGMVDEWSMNWCGCWVTFQVMSGCHFLRR